MVNNADFYLFIWITYIDSNFVFSEFYEPGAFLIEDEGIVIAGLLVGLNVIDCNFCIKGEDLDQPVCTHYYWLLRHTET